VLTGHVRQEVLPAAKQFEQDAEHDRHDREEMSLYSCAPQIPTHCEPDKNKFGWHVRQFEADGPVQVAQLESHEAQVRPVLEDPTPK